MPASLTCEPLISSCDPIVEDNDTRVPEDALKSLCHPLHTTYQTYSPTVKGM